MAGMEPVIAYIGFGSNLGDRAASLLRAIMMLDEIADVRVLRISQMIETDPVGPGDQGKYLNGAVSIETSLPPAELLAVLQSVEAAIGRDRTTEQRWGSRVCDLDILIIDQCVMDTDELTVPHPRMHERSFVLGPLAEIAPQTVHPVLGKTVADLLAELEGGG